MGFWFSGPGGGWGLGRPQAGNPKSVCYRVAGLGFRVIEAQQLDLDVPGWRGQLNPNPCYWPES